MLGINFFPLTGFFVSVVSNIECDRAILPEYHWAEGRFLEVVKTLALQCRPVFFYNSDLRRSGVFSIDNSFPCGGISV